MKATESIEKRVLKECMDMAAQEAKEGCLFVIDLKGKRSDYYTRVFRSLTGSDGRPLSILNKKDIPVIKHLSELDGAVIIDNKGRVRDFGATLKKQKTFLGHGKRHAFALGTSRLGHIVCILASEEDNHVRMFRDGVCVVDMDSKTKVSPSVKQKIVELLDTPLSKILVGAGIATSILTLNPIPAIITITGSSVIVSYGFDKIKKFFGL